MSEIKTLTESELFAAAFDTVKTGDTASYGNLLLKDDPSTVQPEETKPEAEPAVGSEEKTEATPEGDQPAKEEGAKAPVQESKDQPGDEPGNEGPDLGWAAQLDPEIKSKIESLATALAQERKQAAQLDHQYKSNKGRISAYQQALDAKEHELAQLRKQAAVPAKQQDTKLPPLPDDDTLKELEQSDPELAKTLRAREAKLLETFTKHFDARLQSTVEPVERKISESFIAEQNRLIRAEVSNLDEVLSSEYWKEFKQTASPAVAALIKSPHAKDGLAALSLFDTWARNTYPQPAAKAAPAEVKPAAPVASSGVIKARQDRVQSTSATAKGAAVSVKRQSPDFDVDAMFQKGFNDSFQPVKK